nr:hypothetical protein HK105_007608 [Polyrhizophydium stewartii]
MGTKRHGLIDNWLQQVKDLHAANLDKLEALPTQEEREDLMCELNALNSFSKVVSTGIIQGAWERGQKVTVHAWCYRLSDGIIRDLGIVADSNISLNEKLGELIAAKTMPEP